MNAAKSHRIVFVSAGVYKIVIRRRQAGRMGVVSIASANYAEESTRSQIPLAAVHSNVLLACG